jgi:predicted MFS family arabinose efflux permease
MAHAGWVLPVDPRLAHRPVAPPALIFTFWAASLVYAVFHGLMYGTRTALFMDVTNPRVAATQFTAYMSLLNVVISYSATWQGFALAHLGYPRTLALDAVVGLVSLVLLPLMGPGRKRPPGEPPAAEPI